MNKLIDRRTIRQRIVNALDAWRIYIAVSISLVSIYFVVFLLDSRENPILPITSVEVRGQLNWIDKNTLNSTIVRQINGGFFAINVQHIKQRVEQLPWVENVSIRRLWPGKLIVLVKEQRAIAVWNDKELVNDQAVSFNPHNKKFPQGLVKLFGPRGARLEIMDHYSNLYRLFLNYGLDIVAINMDKRRAMDILLDDRVTLKVGRIRNERELQANVTRFLRAYKAALDNKFEDIELVDLRYTNGFSVRWKSENNQVGEIKSIKPYTVS